ncbi:hypothetical protein JNUCC0626_11830 [Lentzea sp. JNUCC 0626]|uniref:hypothetical protein n=1 Tax=Lentzea sp. JNUCC 0626 TaxID=3367513 RepID=UPI00374A2BDA
MSRTAARNGARYRVCTSALYARVGDGLELRDLVVGGELHGLDHHVLARTEVVLQLVTARAPPAQRRRHQQPLPGSSHSRERRDVVVPGTYQAAPDLDGPRPLSGEFDVRA